MTPEEVQAKVTATTLKMKEMLEEAGLLSPAELPYTLAAMVVAGRAADQVIREEALKAAMRHLQAHAQKARQTGQN
jgi:hypothetical protein